MVTQVNTGRTRRRSGFRWSVCGALLAAWPLASSAATTVVGEVSSDTWTVGESPYLLDGAVTIPIGKGLTVQPGVQVVALAAPHDGGGASSLTVEGALSAMGTEGQPIVFRSERASLSWSGIHVLGEATVDHAIIQSASVGFLNTGLLDIKHTSIEAQVGIDSSGSIALDGLWISGKLMGLELTDGAGNISNSVILDATRFGIQAITGSFEVSNCTLDHNDTAIRTPRLATVTVRNSIISNSVVAPVFAASNSPLRFINSNLFPAGHIAATPADGNISLDPGYVSESDFHLGRGSPCIDMGAAEGASVHDYDERRRPLGGGVDMGAFEYDPRGDGAGGRADAGMDARGGEDGGGAAIDSGDDELARPIDSPVASSGCGCVTARSNRPNTATLVTMMLGGLVLGMRRARSRKTPSASLLPPGFPTRARRPELLSDRRRRYASGHR